MKKVFVTSVCLFALCGTFVGGLLAPQIPAQAQSSELRLRARMFAPGGYYSNGVRSEGNGDYRVKSSRKRLKLEASRVNMADGTVLTFSLNGVAIGTRSLVLGRVQLEFDTNNGQTVPTVVVGTVVTVSTADGTVILTGRF